MKVIKHVHRGKRPTWQQLKHAKKVMSDRELLALRGALALLLVGLIWTGFLFTASYRAVIPAVGGEYVEAVVGAPQFANPLFASVNDVDLDIVKLVYSGLMRYDEHQTLVTDLAREYSISEDKKVYTFTLRDDVVWHDGEPFTARDVKLTFDLIQDPQVSSPLLVSFQTVNVEVVDDQTVVFTLEEPFQPFLQSLTVGILPEHVWAEIPYERLKLTKRNLQPVGTGPFMFQELARDETGFIFRYQLTRNDSFYRQPPYIKTFAFQFFGDYETDLGAIHALRQQKVDGLHFVPSDLRDQVRRKHIMIHTLQLPQYTALFYNQKRQPLLGEADVRNALTMALDKDRIVRESLDGEGEVIYSPILPGFPGYNDDLEHTPYDVPAANEALDEYWERVDAKDYRSERYETLLAEATQGFTTSTLEIAQGEDSDEQSELQVISEEEYQGIISQVNGQLDAEINPAQTFFRKTEDDEIVRLRIVTADTAEYRQAAGLIAGFWQELGVITEIQFVAPRDITREALRERKYDVLLYGVIVGSDPDQYPFWHSSQVAYPGLNLAQYVNRSVDELLVKARETDSVEELATLYRQVEEKILADQPVTFLHTPIYRYATTDKLKGVTIQTIFHPSDRFAGVTGWYVKTRGDWGNNGT